MVYISPTLEKIKDSLECGHCGSVFQGSISQAKHFKYEGKSAYCSPVCREAARLKKLQIANIKAGRKPRKGVLVGPCPVCGKMYESKNTDRKYCSQSCYSKSDEFKSMISQNLEKAKATTIKKWEIIMTRECLVCKKEFRSDRSDDNKLGPRKFCSQLCYRKFKADLFDAWVANPQHIAMPQNYDEFMTQNELPCLVDGCDWHGRHLSIHLNTSHGIKAEDFKRAAGFNLSTGLVSPDLHKELCGREKNGVAVSKIRPPKSSNKRGYISNESKEHQVKSRLLLSDTPGPIRTCLDCGNDFQQKSIFGKTLYCSTKCRSRFYYKRKTNHGADQ